MTSAFYKVAREVDGFDEKLEKFKDNCSHFVNNLVIRLKVMSIQMGILVTLWNLQLKMKITVIMM